mmetsp:Transcript_34905/g.56962  ORF Transcript_34905/g.56962 Transcript_34905/m.56962 type:complete len:376 (-) Transcript_34905:248-1375(-)
MAIMKKIGTAVLGLAILVGGIGKFVPYIFMSLPFPLSIILWAFTGNEMPPYFMTDAWKEDEIDSWTKDGDLVVATGPKMGTTFMLYCTHQIRTKGTDDGDELFPDVSISTPWPDFRQSRAGNWAEQKDRYNTTVLGDGRKMKDLWDHPTYPFRIFKSHYAPPVLPVRKEGGKKLKYLVVVRNGIDVAASMNLFYSSFTQEFRNMWGGWPGDAVKGADPPQAVKDLLPGGPIESFHFGYAKGWWPYRNDPNVLLLHYTDARKDLKGHVAKIAKFLEVDLTKVELETVTERCSLEHMKKVNRFRYKMPLNQDKGMWDVDKSCLIVSGALTNTGGVGTGAAKFSDKVVALWKKAEEDEFGHNPAMLKWVREGGEFPAV